MKMIVKASLAAKQLERNRDIHWTNAYAEHRLILATDRYVTAKTTCSKEKARKWMEAWHALRTSRQ